MTESTEGRGRRIQNTRKLNRRRLMVGTAIAAAAAGVTAWREYAGHTEPTAQAQIVAAVGKDGFDLSLGAVRVAAPAGVAPPAPA